MKCSVEKGGVLGWTLSIDIRDDLNKNRIGTQHYLRQRRSSMYMFYLKLILVEWILVRQKSINLFKFILPKGLKCEKDPIFMNSLKFMVLHDNTFYHYILCVTFSQSFRMYYQSLIYLVSSIYL